MEENLPVVPVTNNKYAMRDVNVPIKESVSDFEISIKFWKNWDQFSCCKYSQKEARVEKMSFSSDIFTSN